jgi:hypothetical protein
VTHATLGLFVVPSILIGGTLWFVCGNLHIQMDVDFGDGSAADARDFTGVTSSQAARSFNRQKADAIARVLRGLIDDDDDDVMHRCNETPEECSICFDYLTPFEKPIRVEIEPYSDENDDYRVRLNIHTVRCDTTPMLPRTRKMNMYRCPRCKHAIHATCASEMILIGGKCSCPTCALAIASE